MGAAPQREKTRQPVARICLIRQYYFPHDIRVRREVEALTAAGHEVDVICIARAGEPPRERQGRVEIHRLRVAHRRGGKSAYLLEYASFLFSAMLLAGWKHLRRRYQVVQANSLPDTLVFAALIPKLLGARVALDLHEAMPEFFATKYRVGMGHPAVRLTAWAEQASIRFADLALTCTAQQKEAFVRRGADPAKIDVVLNSADETIFDAHAYPHRGGGEGRFVLISHGSVEERYGLDTIIRAVALLKDDVPTLCLQIFGEGSYLPELQRLAAQLGVTEQVWFSDGFVPMPQLLDAIAGADAGVVAMKRDAFRDLTHCNKMYELIAMGVPVITSRTRSVEAYFPPDAFSFFESDNPADLARAIQELHARPALRTRLVEEAARVNEPYRWPRQRTRYVGLVRRLLAGRGAQRAAVAPEGVR